MDATVSGHVVVGPGVDAAAVEAALADLPAATRRSFADAAGASAGPSADPCVVSFGFASAGPEGALVRWLAAFEALLGWIDEDSPDALRRALLVVDEHIGGDGVHLFHYTRTDAGALRLTDDGRLLPELRSRYAAPPEERLAQFVAAVTTEDVVYGLRGDGWARGGGDSDTPWIPAWSDASRAARAAHGAWSEYAPRPIDLDEWTSGWLTGMVEDGIAVALNPRGPDDATLVSPVALLERLVTDDD